MKQALLVDDSKSARIVLGRLLKKNGFDEVEMAESGEQALEQLKASTPDAIFVDFLMDGMDGLETIKEIKKDPRFLATPIVMCTANEGDKYVRAAVDHGAMGILAKPPTDESLGEIISLIEQHQREQAVSDARIPRRREVQAEPVTLDVAPERASASFTTAGLGEQDVRRIALEVANQVTEQATAKAVVDAIARQVDSAVSTYLEAELEALVSRLIDQRMAASKPQKIDTAALRDEVAQKVNQDLDKFVRQLNQRTMEGLVKENIHEQISVVANDFAQRLDEAEQRIISQVPEKNEMIDHVRVITEGSMEAQVREIATRVAQEIANSVATETVENLMEENMTEQYTESKEKKSGMLSWVVRLLGAAAIGLGFYFFYLR